jgi:hypothetical protein
MADAARTHADLVVGLTSFNDAETIGAVAEGVRLGIERHHAGRAVRVVLADGGSADDTVSRVREVFAAPGQLIEISPPAGLARPAELPYHGFPARAVALRGVLTAARDLQAGACVALEGNLQSLSPDWIDELARPIVDGGADFATPCYARHPVEGALTKGIVYPLLRALFGVRLHQPAASEFACSGALAARLVDEDFWDADGASFTVDLRLTDAVVASDARITEVSLGPGPRRSRSAVDLATTVTQIVRAIFDDVEARATTWQRVRGLRPVGHRASATVVESAAAPAVDTDRLIESFRLGCRELRELWTWVLPPRTIVEIGKAASPGATTFHIDDRLWADVVYDFAVAYRLRALAREHLLRSFVPLYLGWFASFVLDVQGLAGPAVDERVDRLAEAFVKQKPYLIARWRWPERLRT